VADPGGGEGGAGEFVRSAQRSQRHPQRAGLPNSTAVTQSDILLAIENERRVEFALEPAPLVRPGQDGQGAAVLNVTDPDHYLFPIPTPELQADPSLTQNPGY
jgi:hypothetical protein